MSDSRRVYFFGGGRADGDASMRELLGGKGANLAEMSSLGLPVPPGFTIGTDACAEYFGGGERLPLWVRECSVSALDDVGRLTDSSFGDSVRPLLVSVRSGSRASMPGMMDTVLNLGLNDVSCDALGRRSGDFRFALDSYRRFVQMYSSVVMGVGHGAFEDVLESRRESCGFRLDSEFSSDDWREILDEYKDLVRSRTGLDFPQDPFEQLWGAIGAVFASWRSPRAATYRSLNGIPESWGTAVNVQAMVFGNMGSSSATGVAFTRNPSTGVRGVYGEYLMNAQGEDVVAGIRTPLALTESAALSGEGRSPSMESAMPETFASLECVLEVLERRYRDMQDVEFTVQEGVLWMLQTRSGKRSAAAALKIAADLRDEGMLSDEEALGRVDPSVLDRLLHPSLDPSVECDVIGRGLPASPGAASGELVFSPEEAERFRAEGRDSVLARIETSPEDIHGMHAAQGILTIRGGMTSHAAVVARGMGKPCVSGAGDLHIDVSSGTLQSADGRIFKSGSEITLDGSTGRVIFGRVSAVRRELTGDFARLMEWADGRRRMGVRANADTPADAETARGFGAEGIGLCRTEHMFFEAERVSAVREMILAADSSSRRDALSRLLPMQRGDFEAIFAVMGDLPVTIRLLDPPLHEFLPHGDEEIRRLARSMDVTVSALRRRVSELREVNPMLGHRGARLAVTYPEICDMQARAIFEAAIETRRRSGRAPSAEIMMPLVATRAEMEILRGRVEAVAERVASERGEAPPPYLVGAMIELPRAALRAGEIAAAADFFSFGTNDLTQTVFGISRDDCGRFLSDYVRLGALREDPFAALDEEGVGELMSIACERVRAARPDAKLGICGEHGGEPRAVAFCEKIGLDYVSCSPYRVPAARLAAAQAVARHDPRDENHP